jgi:uncharacterized short protein YbdD (DUF466 family)
MNAAEPRSAHAHPPAGWRARLRRAYLQVFGIPDYARYLEHMHAHHPDAPVLTARAFHAQAIDRKYCKSGPRCC